MTHFNISNGREKEVVWKTVPVRAWRTIKSQTWSRKKDWFSKNNMATTTREKLAFFAILAVVIVLAVLWTSSKLDFPKIITKNTCQLIRVVSKQIFTHVNQSCGHTLTNISKWQPPLLPDRLQNVDQENADLANDLCENWIISPFPGPRKLINPDTVHYSQDGQSKYIDKFLNQRTNGFYIECGAASGEGLSNSLFFEKDRNWSGLLIEANPKSFKNLLGTKRHAYMVNACLSPKKTPAFLEFTLAGVIGGLTELIEPGHKKRIQHELKNTQKYKKIQCFPLVSILRALNVSHVDYFSLDIEGGEMGILDEFPFDEIPVDVLTIEYAVSNDQLATRKKLENIKKLLVDKFGYYVTSYQSSTDIMLAKCV